MAEDRWPKDTEDEFYVSGETMVPELLRLIGEKWFGIDYSRVKITPVNHKVRGCYCHNEWGDHEQFICVERIKE